MKTPVLFPFLGVTCSLMRQVTHARLAQSDRRPLNECGVTTLITRPLWRVFLREQRLPEDSEPTGWIGHGTIRVYGSETIVVESEEMKSVSFCRT